ncbi:ABC transporter [Trypanosoma theileri]|uniref:ABC transporter n=1 Tax=Trypanosoma theileri TaxID=67003 RepID=A0A1X0P1Z8_9TRYP|nr:ABC transporter [Trypanosoma theileri]ORC90932.1 ABC transporter [Trypanosoma theileri]
MKQTFDDPLIDLRSVSFEYPYSTTEVTANTKSATSGIHNINLRVNKGDRILVVGHNGSGKSTLLSLIAGRRKALCGSATVLGSDAFDNTCLQQYVSLIGQPWPPEAFFATTVDKIASPAPSQERKQNIADALHISLQRGITAMSSGERRRVQILHGMLQPNAIYLLDECSTDIDVAERKTVLDLIRSECEDNEGGCCLYATHILDGVKDWATHILLMQDGHLVDFKKIEEVREPLEVFAHRFLTRNRKIPLNGESFNIISSEKDNTKNDLLITSITEKEPVIVCNQLDYKNIFSGLTFNVFKGERVLLCGCNGSGKSTLLNMIGGKQFFNNRNKALCVLGKACYEDMSLNAFVALGGDWWSTAPPGEMYVRELLELHTERAKMLRELLDVDMNWDIRRISSGEQKRVQLLLHLVEDKPIVLLDEATSDLDLDQRHALLSFLYSESIHRGVTVMYATHIFGGLEHWPSAVMILDRTARGLCSFWRGSALRWEGIAAELFALKEREKYIDDSV